MKSSAALKTNMLRIIDGDWPRREHFRHYIDNVRCTYSFTVHIDVTALRAAAKQAGIKMYPAQIFALARAVNSIDELRMGMTEDGRPGVWQFLHPAYTIFDGNLKVFSSVWTDFDPLFSRFYAGFEADSAAFSSSGKLLPKGSPPPNVFDVSSVPWLDFTAFNLNIYTKGTHLLPIFTIGRHSTEKSGKTLMPLAVQLHHAACDGYHAGLLVERLESLFRDCKDWLFE